MIGVKIPKVKLSSLAANCKLLEIIKEQAIIFPFENNSFNIIFTKSAFKPTLQIKKIYKTFTTNLQN